MKSFSYCLLGALANCALLSPARADVAADPVYSDHVQPILTKYCAGCHNGEDREGDFSLESFADLQQGLQEGPAILAGQPDSSRLFRVIAGLAEPKMPPEDNQRPSEDDIALLKAWIEAGAKGPEGAEPQRRRLIVPAIARQAPEQLPAVTALATSPTTNQFAVARYSHVEVSQAASPTGQGNQQPALDLKEFPGKVNAIGFSQAGDLLVVASGVAGLYGQAMLFDARSGDLQATLVGHRDALYDAELSPDGTLLATASYDGTIRLWDVATGATLRTIDGHNGAVFDVEFDPTGTVLASASADETIKLWLVETGQRLDTLSQPTAEQYAVAFSPDGNFIVAGGADNRLRVWEFVSRSASRINPLRFTRYAHDGAVVNLRFALDGRVLVTAGADRMVRLWETHRYADSRVLIEPTAAIHALSVSATGDRLAVGLMDGTVVWQDITPVRASPMDTHMDTNPTVTSDKAPGELVADAVITQVEEQEPNDAVAQPQSIRVPTQVRGVIQAAREGQLEDIDLYKFQAKAGEQWIVEIKAARDKSELDSKLDSKVDVLTADGERIERVLLRAVRDSYFTFRGKDSKQSGDFRLHNWEEMQLNEYLYAGGEVTKLRSYPRGPDSGFNVYAGTGDRFTYFGTSAVAHALNEPAYIVEPQPPGAQLIPTGLPVFPVYYENDDDPRRELGADSRLDFTVPTNGDYLIQVRDVRGFGGESYPYELTVRQPQPNFEASIKLDDGAISPGSGKEFTVEVTRKDGFEGEVQIDVDGLPAGFQATTPVIVETGQVRACGMIRALPDASLPAEGNAANVRVTAAAEIGGKRVTEKLTWTADLQLGDEPDVYVRVLSVNGQPAEIAALASEPKSIQPLVLTVTPGQTISAIVRIQRKEGFNDLVSFGKEDAGRNLPHGVYVDNIGLNGLMIVEGAMEREFFITADSWLPEMTRTFHLRTDGQGQQTSSPVILQVRNSEDKESATVVRE